MSIERSQSALRPLPEAFKGESGGVDAILLESIFHGASVRSPSKSIKRLLAKVGKSRNDRVHRRPFDQLADELLDVEFRLRWYREAGRPSDLVAQLFFLVQRWGFHLHPELDFFDGALSTAFEMRGGKAYPRLDNLDPLVDVLIDISKTHLREIALFTWCLIENCRWNGANKPNEVQLTKFEAALIAKLKGRSADQLLALLEPGQWNASRTERGSGLAVQISEGAQASKELFHLSTGANGGEVGVKNVEIDDASNIPSPTPVLVADLKFLQIVWENYKERRNAIVADIDSLNPVTMFARLTNECTEIQQIVMNLDREANTAILPMMKRYHSLATALPVPVTMPLLSSCSSVGYDTWERQFKSLGLLVNGGEVATLQLSAFSRDLLIKAAAKLEVQAVPLTEVPSYCDDLVDEAKHIDQFEKARSLLQSKVDAEWANFAWDPLSDAVISKETFVVLGRQLIEENNLSPSLGIFVRHCFEPLYEEFVNCLRNALRRPVKPIYDILIVLSRLTLAQIVRLVSNEKDISVLLSIVELQSYILTFELGGAAGTDYWSVEPLSDFHSPHHGGEAYEACLHTLLVYFSSEERPSRMREFQDLVIYGLSVIEETGTSDAELREGLNDVLKPHPGGGGNYARLWKKVNDEEFLPLRKILELRGVEAFKDAYLRWRTSLDIGERIREWKSELPPWVRKNSEYDKKIRNAIDDQIERIERLLDHFHSDGRSRTARIPSTHSELLNSIGRVLKSSDSRAQILANWLRNLVARQIAHDMWPVAVSYSEGSAWELNYLLPVSVFEPRGHLKASAATYGQIAADEIVAACGYGGAQRLAEAYIGAREFEAFEALSAHSDTDIPNEIEHKADRDAERLIAELELRLEKVRGRIEEMGQEASAVFLDYESAQDSLRRRRFKATEQELSYLEYAVADIATKINTDCERAELRDGIRALGGDASNIDGIVDLKKAFANLYDESMPRRQHLVVVESLLDLKEQVPRLAEIVQRGLADLQKPCNFPSADQSLMLVLALQPAVEFLKHELGRAGTLKASYAEKLKKAAILVAKRATDPACILLSASSFLDGLINLEAKWKATAGDEILLEHALSVLGDGFEEAVADNSSSIVDGEGSYKTDSLTLTIFESPELLVESEIDIRRYEDLVSEWVQPLIAGKRQTPVSHTDWIETLSAKRWNEAVQIAARFYDETPPAESAKRSERLTDFGIVAAISGARALNLDVLAGILELTNRNPKSTVLRIASESHSIGTSRILDLTRQFLHFCVKKTSQAVSIEGEDSSSLGQDLERLAENVTNIPLVAFQLRAAFSTPRDVNGVGAAVILRDLWSSFRGDRKQEIFRASLLVILWRASVTSGLTYCLEQFEGLDARKARALAEAADEAARGQGSEGLQSFIDLKGTISSKPFQLFVDHLQIQTPDFREPPAAIRFIGPLESLSSGNRWRGVLEIQPRKVHSPDTIIMRLPPVSPLRFGDGADQYEFSGPFLKTTSCALDFQLGNQKAFSFPVEVECKVTTITGHDTKFTTTLHVEVSNAPPFVALDPMALEEAFDGFPQRPQREGNYVPRDEDERKIERLLFLGKSPQSIWIASPRRSGKTTMLFRILDHYSHKAKKGENAVAYLTLGKKFDNDASFNRWVWDELQETNNEELRRQIKDFDNLGKAIARDRDVKQFLGALIDGIRERTQFSRVIFLIDEVDRFTEGHLQGGAFKEFVHSLMWQLRELVYSRPDFAFVFSGSPSSMQFFVEDPKTAFYNSIYPLKLTPFSSKTKKAAELSRTIVEPRLVQGHYSLPASSLDYVLWTCAGIPYYMRLVAGATFACASQSHILESDVTHGLKRLLDKNTGVSGLDNLPAPGSDEYGRIYAQTREDEVLAKAVLLTVAKWHSPISGFKLRRGQLKGDSSPLINRFSLTKEQIDRGLDICLKLDLLEQSNNSPAEVFFAIPLLGETLHRHHGRYWADIEEDLERIAVARTE